MRVALSPMLIPYFVFNDVVYSNLYCDSSFIFRPYVFFLHELKELLKYVIPKPCNCYPESLQQAYFNMLKVGLHCLIKMAIHSLRYMISKVSYSCDMIDEVYDSHCNCNVYAEEGKKYYEDKDEDEDEDEDEDDDDEPSGEWREFGETNPFKGRKSCDNKLEKLFDSVPCKGKSPCSYVCRKSDLSMFGLAKLGCECYNLFIESVIDVVYHLKSTCNFNGGCCKKKSKCGRRPKKCQLDEE
jgi:hypothetical protein